MMLQHWNKYSIATNAIYGVVLFSLMLYTIILSAWYTDDAFISLRHIWNFINGDGITFNYGERVQGFSHPLWFLLLSLISFATQELLLTTIVVSIILSSSAFLMLLLLEIKFNSGKIRFLTPLILLMLSFAFSDYTTSGLENPLTYFLLGLLFLFVSLENFSTNRRVIFFIMSLLVLNRFDYLLLILPLSFLLIIYNFKWEKECINKLFKDMWPGIFVLSSWILFSMIYFGFPLPNTYYGKLYAGFPFEDYLIRGFYYFVEMKFDPATIVIILSSLIISFFSRSKILFSLAFGQIIYLLYIIYIGGDFMRGRFFSVLVYFSVGQLILSYSIGKMRNGFQKVSMILILGAILIGALWDFRFPVITTTDYEGRRAKTSDVPGKGVQDQRGVFYYRYGLLSPNRIWPEIKDQVRKNPEKYAYICGQLGTVSLDGNELYKRKVIPYTTYGAHLIDVCGLTEPILSKIPAITDNFWRSGHAIRKVPQDFGEFTIGSISELPDENFRNFAMDVNLATRGELFTVSRFAAIWRLNTGYYKLENEKYRDPYIWIPRTSTKMTLLINNWNEEVNEKDIPDLKIVSKVPLLSKGVSLLLNPSFLYEVHVNDELIAIDQEPEKSGELNLEFSNPILVNSLRVKSTGFSAANADVRWWVYTYRDKFSLLSLTPSTNGIVDKL